MGANDGGRSGGPQTQATGTRRYPLRTGEPVKAPSYDRVVRGLTDAELEDEILGGRGEAGYQLALLDEMERRGRDGAE